MINHPQFIQIHCFRRTRDLLLLARLLSGQVELSAETRTN